MKMSQRNKLCALSNFFGMIPSRPVTLKERDLVGAEGRVRIEKEIAVKFFTFKCGSCSQGPLVNLKFRDMSDISGRSWTVK